LGEDVDISKLRYHKICILADADIDGFHIQTLVLCLFMKHFSKLVEEGRIYVCCPPLYVIDIKAKGKNKNPKKIYVIDEDERINEIDKLEKQNFKEDDYRVSRFKGLGEMNPDQLKDTTLNPETRTLLKMTIPNSDIKESFDLMDMLLKTSKADERKVWMSENADFSENGDEI
jgi:topoisomerase-4 subunit B